MIWLQSLVISDLEEEDKKNNTKLMYKVLARLILVMRGINS